MILLLLSLPESSGSLLCNRREYYCACVCGLYFNVTTHGDNQDFSDFENQIPNGISHDVDQFMSLNRDPNDGICGIGIKCALFSI